MTPSSTRWPYVEADHGRLARHERILSNLADDADDEVADQVEEALSHVRAYREAVEGV